MPGDSVPKAQWESKDPQDNVAQPQFFSSALTLNAQGSYTSALSIGSSMQCPCVALPFIGADPEPFKTSFFRP